MLWVGKLAFISGQSSTSTLGGIDLESSLTVLPLSRGSENLQDDIKNHIKYCILSFKKRSSALTSGEERELHWGQIFLLTSFANRYHLSSWTRLMIVTMFWYWYQCLSPWYKWQRRTYGKHEGVGPEGSRGEYPNPTILRNCETQFVTPDSVMFKNIPILRYCEPPFCKQWFFPSTLE